MIQNPFGILKAQQYVFAKIYNCFNDMVLYGRTNKPFVFRTFKKTNDDSINNG